MTVFHLFFSPNGRINRAKFILASLLWFFGVCVFALFYFTTDSPNSAQTWIPAIILGTVGGWSTIALGIKRLHDRNKTGWWMVPAYLVPSFLDRAGDIAERGGNFIPQIICIVISLAVAVWIFFCLRGTIGPNPYGDDPVTRDISTT